MTIVVANANVENHAASRPNIESRAIRGWAGREDHIIAAIERGEGIDVGDRQRCGIDFQCQMVIGICRQRDRIEGSVEGCHT